MPTPNCQPIRFLYPDCWYNFTYWMANSADQDQLASSEANWSWSTQFARQGIFHFSRLGLMVNQMLHVSYMHIDSVMWGWLGKAKLLCILCHWGVQLILAYSWARPAILAAGMGRGGMFLFLLFLHFHSFSSFSLVLLFHLHYYLFYLSSISLLPFSERRHKMTHKGWRVIKPQHK